MARDFTMTLSIVALSALVGITAAPASAQSDNAAGSDPVLIPQQVVGPQTPLEGVRIVRPGALVLASFDTNGDMRVTAEERADGAVRSFMAADANGDGALSGFEQQDWAKAAGSPDGPLANALLFDANLDRTVTPAEFSEGLERLARTYADPATGVVAFADLVAEPNGRPGGANGRGRLPQSGGAADGADRQPGE